MGFCLKKIKLIMTVFLIIMGFQLFAEGTFFSSIGYSPGLTDYYSTDLDSHTHTFKYVPLGFNISNSFILKNNIGFGIDFHWGIIQKLTIFNSEARIVIDDWDGTIHQINISPLFLYSPLKNEKMSLIFGVGLSHTMNVYVSDYGSDVSDFYWGITLKASYQYNIRQYIFLNGALRLTTDLIGLWDSEVITSILQIQVYPTLGVGFKL